MTNEELDDFLERHKNIEWQKEEGAMLFRNINLPWYQEAEHHATRVTNEKLAELDDNGLLHQINRGLDVDQITRITGYMGKVSKFNPGKQGELKDRVRFKDLDVGATANMRALEEK
jgi:hypothetical protein